MKIPKTYEEFCQLSEAELTQLGFNTDISDEISNQLIRFEMRRMIETTVPADLLLEETKNINYDILTYPEMIKILGKYRNE